MLWYSTQRHMPQRSATPRTPKAAFIAQMVFFMSISLTDVWIGVSKSRFAPRAPRDADDGIAAPWTELPDDDAGRRPACVDQMLW